MNDPEPVAGLTLRPRHDDDAAALLAVVGDPLLERWTRVRAGDPGEARQWLETQHAGRRTGSRFSFAVLDDAEVGYWTAAYARGRGIAPRALGSLTRWAFAAFPGVRRLRLLHQVDNTGSCRVAVKSGYAYEQTLAACHPYPLEGHLHVCDRQLQNPELAR